MLRHNDMRPHKKITNSVYCEKSTCTGRIESLITITPKTDPVMAQRGPWDRVKRGRILIFFSSKEAY